MLYLVTSGRMIYVQFWSTELNRSSLILFYNTPEHCITYNKSFTFAYFASLSSIPDETVVRINLSLLNSRRST